MAPCSQLFKPSLLHSLNVTTQTGSHQTRKCFSSVLLESLCDVPVLSWQQRHPGCSSAAGSHMCCNKKLFVLILSSYLLKSVWLFSSKTGAHWCFIWLWFTTFGNEYYFGQSCFMLAPLPAAIAAQGLHTLVCDSDVSSFISEGRSSSNNFRGTLKTWETRTNLRRW